MALEAKVKGTLKDLNILWKWDVLCKLVRVDYYNRHPVPENEVFTLNAEDFVRVFGNVD